MLFYYDYYVERAERLASEAKRLAQYAFDAVDAPAIYIAAAGRAYEAKMVAQEFARAIGLS